MEYLISFGNIRGQESNQSNHAKILLKNLAIRIGAATDTNIPLYTRSIDRLSDVRKHY